MAASRRRRSSKLRTSHSGRCCSCTQCPSGAGMCDDDGTPVMPAAQNGLVGGGGVTLPALPGLPGMNLNGLGAVKR